MKRLLSLLALLGLCANAQAAEITTAPQLGTATSSDALVSVDASASTPDTILTRVLFSGNVGEFLSGVGTWVDLTTQLSAKEDSLGNPSVSGYVLSSTTAGVRSWVAQSGGGGSVDDTAYSAAWNGDTATAGSKNAIYDYLVNFDADSDGSYTDETWWDVEPALGNPASDGYVLSSTAAGVRSWVSTSSFSGAWDDIIDPDAASEIDMGAFVTELNVEDFQIGDGTANYFRFHDVGGTMTMTATGNATYAGGTWTEDDETFARTLTGAGKYFDMAAYDVDGTAYDSMFRLTANNTPTLRIGDVTANYLEIDDGGNITLNGATNINGVTNTEIAYIDGATGQTGTGSVVLNSAPTINGKVTRNGSAVDDDDCTGEQGKWWYDDTDSVFEFCNDNTGAPVQIVSGGSTAWDDIGNPDAADEIDMGTHVIELNVADFRVGDGGSNYFRFWDDSGNIKMNAVGNAAIYGDFATGSISFDALSAGAKFQSIAVADLGDTATPSVLTAEETTNKLISNYKATGADHVFTLPTAHAAANVIFMIGDEFQVDIEPPSGTALYLNGTAMATDEHIQNTADTLAEQISCFTANLNGTLTWLCESKYTNWVEQTP